MMRRVGVVGCGRWGSRHLLALQNLTEQADIECIVVCDIDSSALERIQKDSVILHDNPATLAGKFDLDSVIIATPNETHYELGNLFLRQGVDVFLEKPLATTFDNASCLVSTSVQEGKVLKSGFLLRFHPCIMEARKQIRTGRIGSIQSIRYCKKSRREGDASSHVLDALAIHGIDLAEFLLDGQTPLRISEILGSRTSCELTLEYPNQVEIQIEAGWDSSLEVAELEVVGKNGRIVVHLQHHEYYKIFNGTASEEYVECKYSPLEAVLLDFLTADSPSLAASTGSILRTIKCVEQARLQLSLQGRSKTRELKR